ncbi:class E sortase [Kribbella sp. NPDC051718]|uniref:class E sortase n=1 Tax=Kribbella sp. NPDC051718 TaxID=3155168 RepID=UPI003412BF4F
MVGRWAVAVLVAAALVGCADTAPRTTESPPTVTPSEPKSSIPEGPTSPSAKPSTPAPSSVPPPAKPAANVTLAIPSIGVRALRVITYRGTADDKPGTLIQDRGLFASPSGPAGGVGPGEVGNFIVTGHRTAHGKPLARLPELKTGAHILVTADGTTYDYVVTRTMTISFRKPAEKAQQNAPVPGRPGVTPTHPMLTISTCATPEDHAAGNYWHDALNNPEHRINKIATLTTTHAS